MASGRNWKKEYADRANYLKAYRKRHKKEDAARHRARRSLGKIPAGHEVDHKDGNPNNNSRENLKIISRLKNRQKGARKTNRMR